MNPRSIRSPNKSRNPAGTMGPAIVRKFVYEGSRNISATTSVASPIRPPPRTRVPLISRTRSSRLIPGRSLRCLTAAGPFGEKEMSALSANDHSTPENVPILNFNSSGKRSLEVRIIGHRALESGIALHIHQLDKVSGDGNNLARSLIDHRNFHLESTGLMRLFFWPVKTLIATTLALAEPCFPGFDFSNSTIRQGSPSIITYWPILSSPT